MAPSKHGNKKEIHENVYLDDQIYFVIRLKFFFAFRSLDKLSI